MQRKALKKIIVEEPKRRGYMEDEEDDIEEIEFDTLKNVFHMKQDEDIERRFDDANQNTDGTLDGETYFNYITRRAYEFARFLILPQNEEHLLCKGAVSPLAPALALASPLALEQESESSSSLRYMGSLMTGTGESTEETQEKWEGFFMNKAMRGFRADPDPVIPVTRTTTEQQRRKSHADLYTCKPPPVFIFIITVLELSIFFYYTSQFSTKGISVEKYKPAPKESALIFLPNKTIEIWRYVTYMFVHSGYMHLVNNVAIQLVLGILLEMVHRWWRVLIIYFAGGLFCSLIYSIVNPGMGLAGASGGVYALMFAHMSTVTLNWSNMRYPWVRVFLFTLFAVHDCGMAIHYDYHHLRTTVIAHVGGGVAGFLVGILVLRNLELEKWENYLWYVSLVVLVTLFLFSVGWNVFRVLENKM